MIFLHNFSTLFAERLIFVHFSAGKRTIKNYKLNKFKQKYQSSVSDTQKKLSTYNENIDNAAEAIAAIIRRREKLTVPDFRIEKETIQIQTERVHDYEFNSRLGMSYIFTRTITPYGHSMIILNLIING